MKLKHIAIATAIAMVSSCSHNHAEGEHEHDHEHCTHEHCEHDHEGHEHEESEEHEDGDEIVFSPEKAKKFGLTYEKVKIASFSKVMKVSGEILPAQGDTYTVVAMSSGTVKIAKNIACGVAVKAGQTIGSISGEQLVGGDSNLAAKVAYEAAKREYERLKPLFADKIVTESEYNAARENYERTRLAYKNGGAGSSATTAISGTVTNINVTDGAYVEAGSAIATVSKNAKLMLRADIPEKYYGKISTISSCNFKTAYSDNAVSLTSLNGRVISSPNAGSSTGYVPMYFEFNNNGEYASGSYAEVYLLGKDTTVALTVPLESINEEMGNYYVYVRLDEECYDKRLVTIGESNGMRVEIKSGLKEGEEVVVKGAMFVRLAANSGEVPSACSHHHH